jgi:hypothetical protein
MAFKNSTGNTVITSRGTPCLNPYDVSANAIEYVHTFQGDASPYTGSTGFWPKSYNGAGIETTTVYYYGSNIFYAYSNEDGTYNVRTWTTSTNSLYDSTYAFLGSILTNVNGFIGSLAVVQNRFFATVGTTIRAYNLNNSVVFPNGSDILYSQTHTGADNVSILGTWKNKYLIVKVFQHLVSHKIYLYDFSNLSSTQILDLDTISSSSDVLVSEENTKCKVYNDQIILLHRSDYNPTKLIFFDLRSKKITKNVEEVSFTLEDYRTTPYNDGLSTNNNIDAAENRIVIGEEDWFGPRNDGTRVRQGRVFILDAKGRYINSVGPSHPLGETNYAKDVKISGGKIFVSAQLDNDVFTYGGSVYVYDLDGNFIKKFTAQDNAYGRQFGRIIFCNNGKICISKYGGSGKVFELYKFPVSNTPRDIINNGT